MTRKRLELSRVLSTQLLHAMPTENPATQLVVSATRYTSFVYLGRVFLWVGIAAIIASLYWVIAARSSDTQSRMVFSSIKQVGELANVMNKPHFQGLDDDNKPYTVIAEKATQKDAETFELDKISADMMGKDDKWLGLTAGKGEVKKEKETLMLYNNVDMFYEGGYEFRTENAFVDMKAGTVQGDVPVEGQGPMGTLKANSFKVLERGKVIQFNGSVKVVIYR